MKLLFTDLDGTLLTDDKQISPANYAALKKALHGGHKVVIATGRPLCSAKVQAQRLGLDGPGCFIIAYNGAQVYDCGADKLVYELPLPLEALYALTEECNRRGVYIQTYDETHVLVEPHNAGPVADRYCAPIHMGWRAVNSFRRDVTAAPAKVLVIDYQGREKTEAVEQWIHEHLSDQVECFFSSPHYLEVVHKGMDKGRAVIAMCERLGVPVADSVAVGDEANDVSMIAAAGVGVAMANGIPAAKAAADYVTERDNNHDGMVEVVERFVLCNNGAE